MISPDKFWVSDGKNIYDISNESDVISFNWTKNHSDDYIKMSDTYYIAAQLIVTEINDNYRDNAKCDQWFFPAIYLYRQAIELLCKGLLISVTPRKYITDKLTLHKHNIIEIFNDYYQSVSKAKLSSNELIWIRSYLSDLEFLDANSNLFRYPIKEGVLVNYSDKFLDIVDMANSIDQCYSIIYKCVDTKHNPSKYSFDIDLSLKPQVLFFSNHGYGNCMLYTSPWEPGYYPHIKGYSDIAELLLEKLEKNHLSFLTIAFLVRHSIELALKSMLLSRTDVSVDKRLQKSKINSHTIYKDLWLSVKNMVEHYANENAYDLDVMNCADKYLCKLSELDKKGDKFRYPTNYGLEYSLKLEKIDFYQSIYWLISVFNFVDGCSAMLDAAYEYECDMRSEYSYY